MNETVKKKISSHLSQLEIATKLDTKQQNVSRWLSNRIPAERVIPFCDLLNWEVTPHELRPDLYPKPTDGLPTEI